VKIPTMLHRGGTSAARLIAAIAIVALAMTLAVPPVARAFPWSIDMYRSEAVQPLARAPRVTPADTMPVHGGEPPMTREQATVKLHDPLAATPENLARGKELYLTNCAPCHGESGIGDGPAAKVLSRKPADLVHGISKMLPEGYIYGTIRDGGTVMSALADAMSSDERWQVVLYVRSLQAAAKPKVAGK
jgi:mono/diheme cytochrome c family protein